MKKWLNAKNNNQISNYISNFHKEIDSFFNNAFNSFGFSPSIRFDNNISFSPHVDIVENDKEYKIIVEIPGINDTDLKVELNGNILSISGEKKQEDNNENKNYHHVERFYGKFERSFTLPEDSNLNNIDANFKNGVLTIIIQRKSELKPTSKIINIKKY